MSRLESIREIQLRDGTYLFTLGVGDVTCDGHDQSVEYIVNSNVPVARVVLAGRRILEVTGIDLEENFFHKHGDHSLTEEQLYSLAPFGIRREDLVRFTDGDEYHDGTPKGTLIFYDPEVVVYIFCRLIEYIDRGIQLQTLHLPYMNGLLHENPFTIGYGLFDFWS